MFIQTEETPNPLTLKFLPGRDVMGDKDPVEFRSAATARGALLAKKIFMIEGIQSVFFGRDFIAITKAAKLSWSALKPDIFGTLVDYFTLHEMVDIQPQKEGESPVAAEETQELTQIEQEIKELIDARIRPAVAMDGGDIVFERFEDGIVYLQMRGACAGCPSSSATLKNGIENMLKHYVPEVQEVRASDQVDPFATEEPTP